MRARPWMIIKSGVWGWKNIDKIFESKKRYPKGYLDVKSRKDARRELKQERIKIRKWHKELLNDLYRDLRPGTKVNTCGLGSKGGIIDKVIVAVNDQGYIIEIEIPSVGNPNYTAPCTWRNAGGCVGLGWYDVILDDKGLAIGNIEYGEFGQREVYFDD